MDTLTYIQKQFDMLRWQFGASMGGVTDEMLNWAPPGVANTISQTVLHLVGGEDLFFQQILQGKPLLWETQGWSARIGVPFPPGGGGGWEEVRKTFVKLVPILEYEEAACVASSAYLASLKPEDLERKLNLFGREQTVADVLVLVVNHSTGHLGEIAAIKGVFGVKGLQF